jgi:hypothetical protein
MPRLASLTSQQLAGVGVTRGGGVELLYTLDNPNPIGTSGGDRFGSSVSIDNFILVVGAEDEDEATNTRTGKAYVFDAGSGNLISTIEDPNAYGTSAYDSFSKGPQGVSVSNNFALIGAQWEEDANANTYSGVAYVCDVSSGDIMNTMITIDNPNVYGTPAGDGFGSSVAISGDFAVIGAPNEDDNGSRSGTAYVFSTSDVWATNVTLEHTLDNPNAYDTPTFDFFGRSVAISETSALVAVSAAGEDDALGTTSGKVYIFDLATGSLQHTLDNPNPYGTSASDGFGNDIAMHNTTLIVGASNEDDASPTGGGKAYIYNASTGVLQHTLDNPNANTAGTGTDGFGYSVGVCDNYAVVSALFEDDADGTSSGKVYIFDASSGSLLYTLDNPNPYSTSTNDLFGYDVDITKDEVEGGYTVVVSSYSEDDAGGFDSGKVYIYKIT